MIVFCIKIRVFNMLVTPFRRNITPPSSRLCVRRLPTPELNSVALKLEAAVNTSNLTLDTRKKVITLMFISVPKMHIEVVQN